MCPLDAPVQRCAFGHAAFKDTGNAFPLVDDERTPSTPRLSLLHDLKRLTGVCPSYVNNGEIRQYQQDNERARVLAYFDDIIKGQ